MRPTGILSPTAIITITTMSNALRIRAVQRPTVAAMSEVVFMDLFWAGAEYTSQAVGALIERLDAPHRIHQCPGSAGVNLAVAYPAGSIWMRSSFGGGAANTRSVSRPSGQRIRSLAGGAESGYPKNTVALDCAK